MYWSSKPDVNAVAEGVNVRRRLSKTLVFPTEAGVWTLWGASS